MSDLSQHLRALIKDAGYSSQRVFAERLGLTHDLTRHCITNGCIPSSHVGVLCELLATTRDELLKRGLRITNPRQKKSVMHLSAESIISALQRAGFTFTGRELASFIELYTTVIGLHGEVTRRNLDALQCILHPTTTQQ